MCRGQPAYTGADEEGRTVYIACGMWGEEEEEVGRGELPLATSAFISVQVQEVTRDAVTMT